MQPQDTIREREFDLRFGVQGRNEIVEAGNGPKTGNCFPRSRTNVFSEERRNEILARARTPNHRSNLRPLTCIPAIAPNPHDIWNARGATS